MKRIVLITGASRGIGAATALNLAGAGYDIVINYHHSKDAAEELQKKILTSFPVRCMTFCADVSKEEEVEAMGSAVEDTLGSVSVLINNAAVDLSNLVQFKTADEFRRVLDVNVVGAYNCAKRFASGMKETGYGRIINVSSTNGLNTYYPMSFDYDASKAALISLTHNMALQYAPNVHVNAIAPGFIGTESELDGYDEEFLKEECQKILMERYGKPEEVASLIRFLISDDADYINNTVIRIDGGQRGSC